MRSVHHRGTEASPGLVLALDRVDGHDCAGLAYRVDEAEERAVLAYLRERELISSAYVEQRHEITLEDGRRVEAVTYIVDRDHRQYCGWLSLEEQARIIAFAQGGRGPNRDYLWNTVEHLHEIGLPDSDLDWLAARVRALVAENGG